MNKNLFGVKHNVLETKSKKVVVMDIDDNIVTFTLFKREFDDNGNVTKFDFTNNVESNSDMKFLPDNVQMSKICDVFFNEFKFLTNGNNHDYVARKLETALNALYMPISFNSRYNERMRGIVKHYCCEIIRYIEQTA